VLEQDVLDLIRQEGPLTRATIARRCNISRPTASVCTQALLDAGLVREAGPALQPRGRPGRLLAFEPKAGFVVGMDLGGTTARAQLADLDGKPVEEISEPTCKGSAGELISQLLRLAECLVRRHERSRGRVRAIIIGTPGVVDPATQQVHYAPNVPPLEHPGVLSRLAEAWQVPVRLVNDVNLAAFGEASLPGAANGRDFVFVSIGTGLGFGLVRDGKVYQGSAGRAGELGYLPYPPGSATTIESFVSGPGIGRMHARLGGSGKPEDALDEAERGEEPGREAVDRFGVDLAWVLTILSTLLDPHEIVLGGGIGLRCHPFLSSLRGAMKSLSPITPELTVSRLGGRAGLVGAVCQALDDCRSIGQLAEGGKVQGRL
jgi:predicted NBD/HSP70 family sugar kinase